MVKITLTQNGILKVPYEVNKEWTVKIPVVKHRLHKSGTASFIVSDHIKLMDKQGVIFVDMTKKAYVVIPKELLLKYPPEKKKFQGLDNSLIIYNVKYIIKEENLEIIPIEVKQVKEFQPLNPTTSRIMDKLRQK